MYSLVNNDILIKFGAQGGVHINVTDLELSERYYTKIGLVKADAPAGGEDAERKYLKFPGYDYFVLTLSKAASIDRGEAFGRMAFSCADEDV